MGLQGTLTDSDGRYEFACAPTGKANVSVIPPSEADYLRGNADAPPADDSPSRELNFTLERGSVIGGELRERGSDRPIRVPYINVAFEIEGPKPTYAASQTKADGSFRIVTPPGKGRLFTWDSVPGCVPRQLIDAEPSIKTVSEPFEIKPGETLTGKNLHFLRGMTVQGRVLDPNEKPVAGAVFYGAAMQAPSGADGSYTLSGLSPEQMSNFVVMQPQCQLGVKLTIEPRKGSKPVVMNIKLEPTQSATVRVVDEKNRPIANARVSLLTNVRLTETPNGGYSFRPIPVGGFTLTDRDGRAALSVLVVDASYTVRVSTPHFATIEHHFRVEAGKNLELPNLVLLATGKTIAGIVVDQAGRPVEGADVQVMPRNQALAMTTRRTLKTAKDGKFQFHELPAVEFRLLAKLWKPTGELDKDGRPAHRLEGSAEAHVEAGSEDLRITLNMP
jgi:protocatechuate 3,4-dioxygenase beta subunit